MGNDRFCCWKHFYQHFLFPCIQCVLFTLFTSLRFSSLEVCSSLFSYSTRLNSFKHEPNFHLFIVFSFSPYFFFLQFFSLSFFMSCVSVLTIRTLFTCIISFFLFFFLFCRFYLVRIKLLRSILVKYWIKLLLMLFYYLFIFILFTHNNSFRSYFSAEPRMFHFPQIFCWNSLLFTLIRAYIFNPLLAAHFEWGNETKTETEKKSKAKKKQHKCQYFFCK